MNARFDRTREKTKRARRLRGEMTRAEKIIGSKINRGQCENLKFRRQYLIGPYVLDFYCPSIGLCIEIDGEQHAVEAQQELDAQRTAFLEARIIDVLRFWNSEIFEDLDSIVSAIRDRALTLAARAEENRETL